MKHRPSKMMSEIWIQDPEADDKEQKWWKVAQTLIKDSIHSTHVGALNFCKREENELINALTELGVSQRTLAKALDVKPQTISSFQRGVRPMPRDRERQLEELLYIAVEDSLKEMERVRNEAEAEKEKMYSDYCKKNNIINRNELFMVKEIEDFRYNTEQYLESYKTKINKAEELLEKGRKLSTGVIMPSQSACQSSLK